jgi:hypothetical protein
MAESKYNKLSAIVDNWLIRKDLTTHWFNKMLQVAIDELEELYIDVSGETCKVILEVTERKTVILPGDFEDYVIVGIPQGQYFIPMAVNSNLRADNRIGDRSQVINGLLSQNLPNGINLNNYGGYYYFDFDHNAGSGQLPSKGFFRIENKQGCKEILLDPSYCYDEIYLEYITNGINPQGEFYVGQYEKDYVIKALNKFYEEEHNPKATEASIIRRGRELFAAGAKVRARRNPLTPTTMLAIQRANTRMTPRM